MATQSDWERRFGPHERTAKRLVGVWCVSTLAFAYGFGTLAGILPREFWLLLYHFFLSTVGALVSTLSGLVLYWLWRHGASRPLSPRRAVTISLVAPVASLAALVLAELVRVGEVGVYRPGAVPLSATLLWTTLCLLALSSWFAIGALTPDRPPEHVLPPTLLGFFLLVLSVSSVSAALLFAGELSLQLLAEAVRGGFLVGSGAATVLLLVFGWPLYRLGARLATPVQ